MKLFSSSAFAIGVAVLAAPVLAQIQPLPTNPLQRPPDLRQVAKPLEIFEAPTGKIYIPIDIGTGDNRNGPIRTIPIRTRGGSGTVTLSLEVLSANSRFFKLADMPSGGVFAGQIVNSAIVQQESIADRIDPTADNVSKILTVSVRGAVNMNPDETVTIIARDTSGNEKRRSFTVAYTRAHDAPTISTTASATQQTGVIIDPATPVAALDTTPSSTVSIVRDNLVTLRPAVAGGNIGWVKDDPLSEVLCIYGTFKYSCDVSTEQFSSLNGQRTAVTVKVPDIGRGSAVKLVLRNVYGESDPVIVTIDSRLSFEARRSQSFVGPVAGKVAAVATPATRGMDILRNGSSRPCDKPYLVWDGLTTNGKMFLSGASNPFSVKFIGDASVRVVNQRKGTIITNDPDESWAKLEYDLPVGLIQEYVYFLQMSYFTRVGECAARRR